MPYRKPYKLEVGVEDPGYHDYVSLLDRALQEMPSQYLPSGVTIDLITETGMERGPARSAVLNLMHGARVTATALRGTPRSMYH